MSIFQVGPQELRIYSGVTANWRYFHESISGQLKFSNQLQRRGNFRMSVSSSITQIYVCRN